VSPLAALGVVAVAYLAGSIPFSNLFAHRLRGVDLRAVGTGTVSGTGLYRVAGFGPLALAGILDIAKGAVGPLLALGHPVVGALAAAAAIVGHTWSVWLRGAGGRGISPAIGALLVVAWPGAVVLLVGMAGGRLAHHTGLGSFVADVVLVPVLALTHGADGALAGVAVLVPLVAKRLAGNEPPDPGSGRGVYLNRLLFDADSAALDE
jgi:glycerol-3-phosphate acyltransferase PlsY